MTQQQQIRLGQTRIVDVEGKLATYRAAIKGVAVSASGVVLQLQGNAAVIGRINQVTVSGNLTAGAAVDVELQRYSTGATGGTANTPSVGKNDIGDPVPSCTLTTYSTPPTAGTLVGDLAARKTFFPAPANGAQQLTLGRSDLGKGIKVQGTGDFACVALTTGTWTGASVDLEIEWTEEPA